MAEIAPQPTPAPRHPTEMTEEALLRECEIRFQRRSGPGGQHRNKVETAVILRHLPTQIEVQASERRQQAENRAVALERLRLKLAVGVRSWRTEPSTLWRQRCQGGRIRVNQQHPDRAALLAESLDVLAQFDWEVNAAADFLACSRSQLVRLLQTQPEAFALLNEERLRRGLRRLQ